MIWDEINKLNLLSLSVVSGDLIFDYLEDNKVELPGYNKHYVIPEFKYVLNSVPNKGYIDLMFIEIVESEYRLKSRLKVSTSKGIVINGFNYTNMYSIINKLGNSRFNTLNGITLIDSPFRESIKVTLPTTTTTLSPLDRLTYLENKVSLLKNSGQGDKYLSDDGSYKYILGSDSNYVHDQGIPSSSWVITHPLNKKVSVTILDTAGTEIEGSILQNTGTSVLIEFNNPFSGTAILN
jgi:hypothetical protein